MRRRYSQWDWGEMRFNYYEGNGLADPGGFARLRGIRQDTPPSKDGGLMGVDVDAVLRPLPPGSRFLGTGTKAIGEVVKSTRSGGSTRRLAGLSGVGAGVDVIDPLLDEMAAASGGSKSHPGVTVEALDHPPFAVATLSGMAMGFGLGRAFGSKGKLFAWIAAGLIGLMAAGARRKAFLRLVGERDAKS